MSRSFLIQVSIHCKACERKVEKVLCKIDGVSGFYIDAKEGRALVKGNVDPAIVVNALNKARRRAKLLEDPLDEQPEAGGGQQEDNDNENNHNQEDNGNENNHNQEDNGNENNQNINDNLNDYNQNHNGGWNNNGRTQPTPGPYMWDQDFQRMHPDQNMPYPPPAYPYQHYEYLSPVDPQRPYDAPSWGSRAPRNVDPYTNSLSDENPNACSIM